MIQGSGQSQKIKNSKIYTVLAMMSGTSLDGIDLSLAQYWKNSNKWTYKMLKCKTFAYEKKDLQIIKQMQLNQISYLNFRKNQIEYSKTIVNFVNEFIEESNNILQRNNIDFLSLHGHTIFHNPSNGITVQAANLPFIAAQLKMDVIGNFRELDVHHGGQGAPLVPYGQQLFGDYIYLNLGGIANIGYCGKGFDIVFCNIVLNQFSQKINKQLFDQDGNIGRNGKINNQYLKKLQKNLKNQKYLSLARQKVQKIIQQIKNSDDSIQELTNKMRTFYHFISSQIGGAANKIRIQNQQNKLIIYCTGGGAYNKFLIQLLNKINEDIQFLLPHSDIVEFKQALIFGLLGVKFMERQKNCANGVGGELVKGYCY